LRAVPTSAPFQIVISRVDRDVMISPYGDIDASTSATLALALSSMLAEDRPSVVLNLADVAALALDRAWVIGEASRLLTQRDGRFAVVGANPTIRDVLRSTDLDCLLIDANRRDLHCSPHARQGAA
jgi:anti-anti-sigma factor